MGQGRARAALSRAVDRLIRAKAVELVTAGAMTVCEASYGEHLCHVVMLDPEGNEFCVA